MREELLEPGDDFRPKVVGKQGAAIQNDGPNALLIEISKDIVGMLHRVARRSVAVGHGLPKALQEIDLIAVRAGIDRPSAALLPGERHREPVDAGVLRRDPDAAGPGKGENGGRIEPLEPLTERVDGAGVGAQQANSR